MCFIIAVRSFHFFAPSFRFVLFPKLIFDSNSINSSKNARVQIRKINEDTFNTVICKIIQNKSEQEKSHEFNFDLEFIRLQMKKENGKKECIILRGMQMWRCEKHNTSK